MDLRTKRWIAFCLTLVYYCGITLFAHPFLLPEIQSSQSLQKEKYFSAISNNLVGYALRSENSTSHFTTPFPDLKNPFLVQLPDLQWTEEYLLSQYHQYRSFARNLLINHRKSDIIFPFHYFW